MKFVLLLLISMLFPMAITSAGPTTFEEIKNQYTLKQMAPLFKSKAGTANLLKEKFLKFRIQRELFQQFNVCYKRFQLCSSQLSPEFCAAPEMHLSFFFWARKLAKDIMGGAYDGHSGLKCSHVLVTDILLRIQTKAEQRSKVLAMVHNSMTSL